MLEVHHDELKKAIESQHGGRAKLVQSVPISETFEGEMVWQGVVHVFELVGHPKAKMAYAWSSQVDGSNRRRFFAVLHLPPITNPTDAVRAAIIVEHKSKKS